MKSDRSIHSGMTMTSARPRHRSPWIALAAFLVALTAAGGANACTTMAEGRGACAAACGCCEAPASAEPSHEAVAPVAAPLDDLRSAEVCGDVPTGCCACSSGQPDAPEPRAGGRTTGEETDAGRDLAGGESALDAAPRVSPHPIRPTGSPPQGSPLYLRHSRLLI